MFDDEVYEAAKANILEIFDRCDSLSCLDDEQKEEIFNYIKTRAEDDPYLLMKAIESEFPDIDATYQDVQEMEEIGGELSYYWMELRNHK
jgi:chromosome condensin MukBEF complex kleisin-like MukF subunit